MTRNFRTTHSMVLQDYLSSRAECWCIPEPLCGWSLEIRVLCVAAYVQECWYVLTPTRKETSYNDRRFWCSYVLFIII